MQLRPDNEKELCGERRDTFVMKFEVKTIRLSKVVLFVYCKTQMEFQIPTGLTCQKVDLEALKLDANFVGSIYIISSKLAVVKYKSLKQDVFSVQGITRCAVVGYDRVRDRD